MSFALAVDFSFVVPVASAQKSNMNNTNPRANCLYTEKDYEVEVPTDPRPILYTFKEERNKNRPKSMKLAQPVTNLNMVHMEMLVRAPVRESVDVQLNTLPVRERYKIKYFFLEKIK